MSETEAISVGLFYGCVLAASAQLLILLIACVITRSEKK